MLVKIYYLAFIIIVIGLSLWELLKINKISIHIFKN